MDNSLEHFVLYWIVLASLLQALPYIFLGKGTTEAREIGTLTLKGPSFTFTKKYLLLIPLKIEGRLAMTKICKFVVDRPTWKQAQLNLSSQFHGHFSCLWSFLLYWSWLNKVYWFVPNFTRLYSQDLIELNFSWYSHVCLKLKNTRKQELYYFTCPIS